MTGIVNYKLKQETPMIHFQYDEPGATLRGSDVKPRLDKFLIRQMEREHPEDRNYYKRFVTDPDHGALDYKIRIRADKNSQKTVDPPSSFFGNMGGDKDKYVKAVINTNLIDLRITCFHPELMKMIQQYISAFFFFNNFGTRQDKGSGSFTIADEKTGKPVVTVESILSGYAVKDATIWLIDDSECYNKKNKRTDHLTNADMFYKLIKSGINTRTTYRKALLTKYMLKKSVGGEKRWMKQQGIAPITGDEPDEGHPLPVEKYQYIRAVLGVTDSQRWKKPGHGFANIKIEPAKKTNPVQRYASPLVFTIYDGKLYLIAYEPNGIIFGQEYIFSSPSSNRSPGKLKTPPAFQMADFMRYVEKELPRTDEDGYEVGNFENFNGSQFDIRIKKVGEN